MAMPSPPTHTLGRLLETTETGQVTFDARLHRVYRERSTGIIELLLRDNGGFVFGLVSPDIVGTATLDLATRLTRETLLRVSGQVRLSEIAGNDAKQYEGPTVQVLELAILGEAVKDLPIGVVSHEAPGEGSAQIDAFMLNERLNNRVLDVRVASTGAVIKLFSSIYELAFEHLIARGFVYITTPSLIDYQVPGDDDYFELAYFGGRTARLTQTGELHLGQALSAGLERVFEVHPVFRREKSSSPRHLTEVCVVIFCEVQVNQATQHY
jgi:aspartyl/asparaginyl-tRNA synthetase